jgi:signal transduction histidine kinase/DNA-binding NarL/FixJ family response regulator
LQADHPHPSQQRQPEAKILGQLLVTQSLFSVLPDEPAIVGFTAQAMAGVPGVAGCRVCIQHHSSSSGQFDAPRCLECPHRNAAPSPAAGNAACLLASQPGFRLLPMITMGRGYGYLVFQLAQTDEFAPYEPFLLNYASFIALFLENRNQREQLQRANQHLELARAAAEAASQAKSAFLANMSHELRTPLHAILGYSQLLQQEAPPSQRRGLETINRSGQHLLRLINDVLEMSRLESGRLSLTPRAFNLQDLLNDLDMLFRDRAESAGLRFSIHIAPDTPRLLLADEVKLRQILVNLLGKALKFTDSGQIQVEISANAQDAETWRLRVNVLDTGIGIGAEDLQRLFMPFEQTAQGRQMGGTGLGLALSRQYAELMGGSLTAQSQVGQGSCFCLEILARLAAGEITAPTEPQRQVMGLAPGQHWRIVVAGPDADSRALLSHWLSLVGFEAREAGDSKSAISLCGQWRPHAVLLDTRLGLETISSLRAGPQASPIHIIALASNPPAEEESRLRALGADACLPKPVALPVVLESLRASLGVEFIYGENYQKPAQPAPAMLAELPADLRRRLREQAQLLEIDGVNQAIREIAEYNRHLADSLRDLARRYDFQKLADLARE